MSWTDFRGKVNAVPKWLMCCTLLSFSFISTSLASEGELGTLVCDDQINVALDGNCESEITVEMILEGESAIPGFDAADYNVSISGVNGPVNGMTLSQVGLYTVTISEVGTGPNSLPPPYNSCWGHILVEDKLPPQLISCPCEASDPATATNPDCVLPILCEDLTDIGGVMVDQPEAMDNCNNDFTVTFTDDIVGADCASSIVLRTWRLTDTDGNYVTCQSRYSIDPLALTNNIDEPIQNVELECGEGTSPEEIYLFFADYYRTANPCAGGGSTCDPTSHDYDPDFVAAYEQAVHQFAVRYAYPSINGVQLIGNICNTVTSFEDTVIPICSSEPGCEGNAKIIRTWTIYDWCDPNLVPLKYSQVIQASDHTDPSIDAESFTASVDPWGCTAKVIFPEPLHLTDNCSSYVTYTVTGSGSSNTFPVNYDPNVGYYAENVPVGEHTFYYNAFDCCENTTSEGVVVTVVDATPPVAITKQDIVVSLIPNPGNLVEPGLTKIFAGSVDNGSFDGCGPVKLEIRREEEMCGYPSSVTFNDDGHAMDDSLDIDQGAFVQFCCTDIDEYGTDVDGDGFNDYAQIKVWLRVWDDGDGDGYFGSEGDNFSEVWSYVRLEDKSKPTILCPPDVVIDCDGDSANLSITGEATGVSSCGPVGVSYVDIERDLTNCNEGTIRRRWTVDGHPSIYCDQYITLSGTIVGGPITVEFPKDTLITCEDYLDEEPTWQAGTCDLMAYSVERDTFYFSEGACYKVLNYWSVINWCTYDPAYNGLPQYQPGIWRHTQVVKIIDETAPNLVACQDTTFDAGPSCIANGIMLTNTAEDLGLCSSDRLKWIVEVDLNGDWSIDYEYSSLVPSNSPYYIPPSSSGQEIKITLPEGVAGSMTNHLVTWRVSDGCGNFTSCTTSFMVVDNIPPTPYCVNLSTALMQNGEVELWACDFDLGAFDNCSDNDDLRFTFTNVKPSDDPDYNPLTNCSSKTFTCDDIVASGGNVITLDVYVWDEKDNFDFCTVFLTLVDNNNSCPDIGNNPGAQIGGQVFTEFGQSLQNVDINLISTQPEYPLTNQTDNSGHYMFYDNTKGMNYEISGHNNNNPLNGVSTLDLILIQRHILGLKRFDSPYKMIASDINNDEIISSLDLLELRKLILGIYDEFPQNYSWRFIEESSILNANNPWPLVEQRYVANLDDNMMTEDFIGVKIGDVNGTAAVNLTSGNPVSKSNTSVVLTFEDKSFVKGETVELNLSADQILDLAGMQFTMETGDLELVSVQSSGMNVKDENVAKLNSNLLTFSWSTPENIIDTELFTLTFKAKSNGTISQNIKLSSEVTTSEVYLGNNLDIIPVKLIGRNNSEQAFKLYQNNPNPFNGSTNISFDLPEASDVTISVMDVTGKIVWSLNSNFGKGNHSVDVTAKEINTSGVLYYKLEAGSMSATKKMIIIE